MEFIKYKTMEYKILERDDTRDLAEQVNIHLSEGWSLQGGISVSKEHGPRFHKYCQALVR